MAKQNSKMSQRIRDLPGLGPQTETRLASIGVHTVSDFMARDPYDIYAQLSRTANGIGLNGLYAIIGAQEGVSWLDIAGTRKMEILMRLDDLGLAPE